VPLGDPEQHLRLNDKLMDLIEAHPDSYVLAFDESGKPVDMPASVPLRGQRVMPGRPGVQLAAIEGTAAFEQLWQEVRREGHASVELKLIGRPEQPVITHVVDVRASYGVYVCLFLVDSDRSEPLAVGPAEQPILGARVSRVRKDGLACLIEADSALTSILGWSKEDLLGRRSLDFVHPDDHARGIESWMDMLTSPGSMHRVRLRHRSKSRGWIWLEVTNHNLLDDPQHACVVSEMVDISDEMATHEALRAREQLLDRLAEALPIGLIQIDTRGNVVYTNDRLRQIFGMDFVGNLYAQLAPVFGDDRETLIESVHVTLRDGVDSAIVIRLETMGRGPMRHCGVTMKALTDGDGVVSGAIICVEDVTSRMRMRRELEYRATYDALTRCHNRASIMATLESSLREAAVGQGTAVIFVDLDRFKAVNDQLGHGAGDQILRTVSDRLRASVRSTDVVGRLGGDEFLIVCPHTHGPDKIMLVAERIGSMLREPIELGSVAVPNDLAAGRTTKFTPSWPANRLTASPVALAPVTLTSVRVDVIASIGVAWTAHRSLSADQLVAEADLAMYESKRTGAGRPMLAEIAIEPRSPAAAQPLPSRLR
jgi:diguanylate cyclase (GGDEF)-like protein/PAS domain S-box-containing protein